MKRNMRVLCISVMLALSPAAMAQKATGQALVAGKIAANFTNLAGSDSNALALVNALRTGTNATLTYPAPATSGTTPPPTGTGTTPPATGTGTTPPPATTTVTYDPPTGKMGWGNVKIALGLAQASLAGAGITNPTADQLQAALNGGNVSVTNADGTTTTTTLKGVLQMRASGMGWGQIAQANGSKLGPVVSGIKMGSAPATGGTSPPTGVVAAKSMSANGSGAFTANGNAFGRGIVTAAGGGASFGASTAASHGNGAGVVTASGGAATSVTSAQGNSGNHGKPDGKGKGGG